jgi:beta-glucosidase
MENFEQSEKTEEAPNFDFTAKEVLETLKPTSESSKIEYVGSATSDFQAHPLLYGPDGNMLPPMSDWEFELQKNIQGKTSGIKKPQDESKLPRFFDKPEKYIDRSDELGENMFRFSLDFGRLCPEKGEFNEELMADYVKALALIRAKGQEPMLTIHHFTMPKFLVETNRNDDIVKGGWENPDVSKHFRFYIENVTKFLGDEDKVRGVLNSAGFAPESQDKFLAEGLVKYFVSLNEPFTTLLNGYTIGVFPPYKKGGMMIKKVLERMVEAHDMSRDELKKLGTHVPNDREPQVGATYNWQYFDGLFGSITHKIANELTTNAFERDGAHSDFLGLQYYFRNVVTPFASKKGRDFGDHPGFGDMYPPGILEVLKKMNAKYPQKEIFITEMGFADNADKRRPYWMLETMRYVLEAKRQGLPIKGMLLWSMVNNFEWDLGMDTKFGLFDEKQLSAPLVPTIGGVSGWEAWKAATKAITSPSPESLQELQNVYEKAKMQFDAR